MRQRRRRRPPLVGYPSGVHNAGCRRQLTLRVLLAPSLAPAKLVSRAGPDRGFAVTEDILLHIGFLIFGQHFLALFLLVVGGEKLAVLSLALLYLLLDLLADVNGSQFHAHSASPSAFPFGQRATRLA